MIPTLNDIRQIQWGTSWQYNIRFPNAPSPFNEWFPCSDVEEDIASLNLYALELTFRNYLIPRGMNPHNIKITFYDDVSRTITLWLKEWIEFIIDPEDGFVRTLSECCDELQVQWLDNQGAEVRVATYLVCPNTGQLVFKGTSGESRADQKTYDFMVMSVEEETITPSQSSFGSVPVFNAPGWPNPPTNMNFP